MTNKKGLSDVVTVVLIILLALAAVGIIWAFIKPALNTAGGKIDVATECLNIEVEPISCTYKTDGNEKTATIKVKHTRGNNIAEATAIAKFENGATATKSEAIGIFGTTEIKVTYTEDGDPIKAEAAGAVLDEEGGTYNCDPSPIEVNCDLEQP